MRSRILGVVAAVAIMSLGGSAWAQRGGGGGFVGPYELSGMLGPSFGITDFTPGGFKLQNEFGYRVSQKTWFNAQLNFTLGGSDYYYGYGNRICYDQFGNPYRCGGGGYHGFSGDAIELVAGVKLKFPKGRLLPYAKFGGGFVFSFFGGDYGATALVFRGGGGLKYFVLRQLAVGGELMLAIGPDFVSNGGGTHAYAALDLLGGIEWDF
ncbi:MAG TPA: hypothetical protein VGQ83_11665 [Polyangia bacterium]